MELKGLEDLMVPADAKIDVRTLMGRSLRDVNIGQIITASSATPRTATPTPQAAQGRNSRPQIEEVTDGDNFI